MALSDVQLPLPVEDSCILPIQTNRAVSGLTLDAAGSHHLTLPRSVLVFKTVFQEHLAFKGAILYKIHFINMCLWHVKENFPVMSIVYINVHA